MVKKVQFKEDALFSWKYKINIFEKKVNESVPEGLRGEKEKFEKALISTFDVINNHANTHKQIISIFRPLCDVRDNFA